MNGVEKTVFIVEDALEVRVALTRILHVAGYRVRSFKSAEDFLEEQDEEEPGCLLLDVFLPGLSGIELQRELARSPLRRPIVFLTGNGDIKTGVGAMKEGAVDFLTKPIDSVRLFAAVEQALQRDQGAACASRDSSRDSRSPRNADAARTASDGAGGSWPFE